jgi:hypothetical protein
MKQRLYIAIGIIDNGDATQFIPAPFVQTRKFDRTIKQAWYNFMILDYCFKSCFVKGYSYFACSHIL